MDVHARIHTFLQQHSVISLVDDRAAVERQFKAGVVPFLRGKPYRFFLMKPVARHKNLEAPKFQLCKGTRMQQVDGQWRDLRDYEPTPGEKETLAVTALREGIEELGLRLEGITSLFELGMYTFSSAKSGKSREMWMFAAEMAGEGGFSSEVVPTTQECAWLAFDQFRVAGRDDHHYILKNIETRLRAHYKD